VSSALHLGASSAAAARAAAALKVAVVDDSPSVCKAIERLLVPRGFVVSGLRSAGEAIGRLEDERPDLVVCDLVLPDRPGLDVCRFVRASRRLGDVPLLVVSGVAGEEARRQALAAGADGVLEKPFRGGALLAGVEALLAPASPAALGLLDALARLPCLAAGAWRPVRGEARRLGLGRDGARADAAPELEALLVRLRAVGEELELGAPELLELEGRHGELVLVAQRPARGRLSLRLTRDRTLSRARHLAREFLQELCRRPGFLYLDRKERPSWTA
jgi:DNA-binding response OmpR family regulator